MTPSAKDEILRLLNVRWNILNEMNPEEISGEWARWTCPVCLIDMHDPVSTDATLCANNHIAYLGEVYDGHRRAFSSRAQRRIAKQHDDEVHDTVQSMFQVWKKKYPSLCVRAMAEPEPVKIP